MRSARRFAESAAAWLVRLAGAVLAGGCAAIAGVGLVQGGDTFVRSASGLPLYAAVLAAYLGAFLVVTRRDSGLPPRAALTSVGFGLLAGGLFAAAVPVLPPVAALLAFLLIAAAAGGAAWRARPDEGRAAAARPDEGRAAAARPDEGRAAAAGAAAARMGTEETRAIAALFGIVVACQAVFLAAAVLYYYGPDSWMPYAGPGPLTPQAQLEQNRAEAIDPYVGPLFIGLIAAIVLIGRAVTARRRARAAPGSVALPPA
ncbi:hypothetical protein ODJ79_42845 [Actinoplanes sp. KI2]|uniref:hypothetical protein n=1 Tax=Actinoplanes sp. KI2 TaxID=2983315 RepID=UPI0021D5DB2C|nr:hypothetical protein [Actinoplanes sp. KI2]MCU7730496.1 hypothetical protein [Actinoplanes sp. KI2]